MGLGLIAIFAHLDVWRTNLVQDVNSLRSNLDQAMVQRQETASRIQCSEN